MNSVGEVSGINLTPLVFERTDELFDIDNAGEVIDHLGRASQDDLVIFDVDEVLITLKDKFLRPKAEEFCNPIFFELFGLFADMKTQRLYGEWNSQVEVELVSEELPECIRELQRQHIKVIALTAMMPGAGPCGKIQSMEDFRYQELKTRGIDFSTSVDEDRVELDFVEKYHRTPTFKDGIIYSSPYPKGQVLKDFLNKISFKPRKIWFVDDRKENVLRVQAVCKELNISFVGITYFDRIFQEDDFDKDLGIFQFQHFKETGVWLSDEKAKVNRC